MDKGGKISKFLVAAEKMGGKKCRPTHSRVKKGKYGATRHRGAAVEKIEDGREMQLEENAKGMGQFSEEKEGELSKGFVGDCGVKLQ